MVGVVVEDVLVMGGVGRHVAITWLGIVRVFGFVPLDGWARDISLVIELRSLYPTFGHAVVAQFSDDGVVAITSIVGVGRCTLHRRNTRRCAQLAVVVLALSFYLHHTHLVVFLPGRDDVCAVAVGVLEYARTDFGGHAPVADEIVLGETLARNAEYGCGVDRDIAVARLGIVRVFVLLPLNGCDNVRGVLRTVIMLSSTMNMGLSS